MEARKFLSILFALLLNTSLTLAGPLNHEGEGHEIAQPTSEIQIEVSEVTARSLANSLYGAGSFRPLEMIDKPFLYRIEKDGKTSYMLGSLHSSIHNFQLNHVVHEKMQESTQFAFEVNLNRYSSNPDSYPQIQEEFLQPYGERLQDKISPRAWAKLQQLAPNIDTKELNTLTPSSVSGVIGNKLKDRYLRENGLPLNASIDGELLAQVADRGIKIQELDNSDYFTDRPGPHTSEEYEVLEETLENFGPNDQVKFDSCFGSLRADYVEGDLEKTMESFNKCLDKSSNRLIENIPVRNKGWIPLMEEMHGKDKAFFVFGLAHLPGEEGVIKLLQEKGYHIQRVPGHPRPPIRSFGGFNGFDNQYPSGEGVKLPPSIQNETFNNQYQAPIDQNHNQYGAPSTQE